MYDEDPDDADHDTWYEEQSTYAYWRDEEGAADAASDATDDQWQDLETCPECCGLGHANTDDDRVYCPTCGE
ncbi:hypothetical protein ACWDD9_10390 [Kitasatospora sp. NPDC001119]